MTTFGHNCQWLSLLRRLGVVMAMMMSLPTAAAFLGPRPLNTFSSSVVPSTLTVTFSTLSPEEERAAALSDYLAKAHEEKLKMIQQVEMKKNQEIDELKQQIAALKKTTSSSSSESSSSSAVVMVNGNADAIAVKALEDMTPDELRGKVLQYQQVLRQYMIDAQEEKYRAVQAAQAAAQQKLTESLTLLGWTPSSSAATSITLEPSRSSSAIVGSPLYVARNAAVSKAGAQSRWGPLEVQRVSGVSAVSHNVVNGASSSSSNVAATPPTVTTTMPVNGGSVPVMSTTATTVVPVPPEVAEADHGLRSDGSIGGLTLAERIYFGAQAAASDGSSSSVSTTTSSSNPMTVLYQKRNIKVQQVAQVLGKSNRWGAQEVERVSNIVAATAAYTSGITATSSTSQQRVNFGAAILGQ